MNKTGLIYKVISPSGKIYIGQTIQTLHQRKNGHYIDAFNKNCKTYNCKFARAIRKYNDNLKWTILYNNISIDLLDKFEIENIKKFDSFSLGYNGTEGGKGSRGRSVSKNTREKLSKANIGKKLSKETKKKISKSVSGQKHYFYGKHHSKKTRKKLSKINKGKKLSAETKQKISKAHSGEKHYNAKLNLKIAQKIRKKYTTNKYTQRELAKQYNVSQKTIYNIVNCLSWIK